jgi:extracellular matrix regulatory protein A
MSNKHNGIGPGKESAGRTLNLGYGNFVLATRVISVLEAGSLPMKRLRERASSDNMLVDATAGRKTRSILITDSRHVILSALSPQALQERFEQKVSVSPAEREVFEGEFFS